MTKAEQKDQKPVKSRIKKIAGNMKHQSSNVVHHQIAKKT